MTRDEVKQRFLEVVNECLREDFSIEELDEEDFLEELGADSLDITEIIVELEEALGVEISRAINKDSIGDIIDELTLLTQPTEQAA